MSNLNQIFGSTDETLDEVVIYMAPAGGPAQRPSTITLPAGYTWSDFEYIELSAGFINRNLTVSNTTIISKEWMARTPDSWEAWVRNGDGSVNQDVRLVATSSTTIASDVYTNDAGIAIMKGYTKRYASRNLSAIVNVNSGADITTGGRYEIDIAAELGPDYVGRDLVIEAEILNNSGTGEAGWFNPSYGEWQFQDGTNNSSGIQGSVLNDKIVAITGRTALSRGSGEQPNIPNHTATISTTQARIKVWKIDQYVTNNTLDLIEALEVRIAALEAFHL